MKAMIFAAGLGTRLKPLTNDRPKALVEVGGRSLLEWNLLRLRDLGYTEVVVNVHHFAEKIVTFLKSQDFGMEIHISYEPEFPLETGGGLKKAERWLKDAGHFLVHNVDIISNVDLEAFRHRHLQSGALATLGVSERETSRYLLFDQDHQLCGWCNKTSGEIIRVDGRMDAKYEWAFSGIHYISSAIFDLLEEEERAYSIIQPYLNMAQKEAILAFNHSGTAWVDVGKMDQIPKAEAHLEEMNWSLVQGSRS